MSKVVSVKNLHTSFDSLKVLQDISFEVQKGEVVAIIGPSGAGKTTLLRCLNLLTGFDSGEVEVAGFALHKEEIDQKELRKKVGMVFQQFNLWPNKTVLENVSYAPVLVKGLSKAESEKISRNVLEQVGLKDKEDKYPSEISGGQQQRVAIARAMAMDPEVLLLDEITSALDPELVGEVLKVIREIAQEHKTTLVIVTHEMSFAKEVADKVIFLDQGKLIEEGKAKQVLSNPQQERTQKFLSRVLKR